MAPKIARFFGTSRSGLCWEVSNERARVDHVGAALGLHSPWWAEQHHDSLAREDARLPSARTCKCDLAHGARVGSGVLRRRAWSQSEGHLLLRCTRVRGDQLVRRLFG